MCPNMFTAHLTCRPQLRLIFFILTAPTPKISYKKRNFQTLDKQKRFCLDDAYRKKLQGLANQGPVLSAETLTANIGLFFSL